MKKVIIVDGNSLAYSSIPNPEKYKKKFLYSGIDNRNIFIVRKFIKKILKLKFINYYNYHFIIVFDEQNKFTFRHELDKKYKSKKLNDKRIKQKNYVYSQIAEIKKILDLIGIPYYSSPNWEADDIIGMLVSKLEKKNILSTIITGDKDILQLISDKTRVQFNTPDNKSILTDRKNVWDISGGVWPDQLIDIKILAGDNSDNIKGLGLVREGKVDYWKLEEATKLIKKWGSIDLMIKNIDKIEQPFKKSLEKGIDKINHNKKLVTIIRDWKIDIDFNFFMSKKITFKKIDYIFNDLNLQEFRKNKRFLKEMGK